MIDDIVQILSSQFAYLIELEGDRFAAQLPEYLTVISRDPRVKAIFSDVINEASEARYAFVKSDEASVSELVPLRRELVKVAPQCDDSEVSIEPNRIPRDPSYLGTLANFDRVAAGPGMGPLLQDAANTTEDLSQAKVLIGVLFDKLSEIDAKNSDARYEELHRRLGNIQQRHAFAFRTYALRMRTSAGVSAIRLMQAQWELNAAPIDVGPADTQEEMMAKEWRRGGAVSGPLARAIFSPRNLTERDRKLLAGRIVELKEHARRLHEELLLRLRTVRSYRALVDRFKLRCESYDREKLRALTEGTRNPENLLIGELARYLFDAGLTPLTGAQIGGLRPDSFEHTNDWTFYLEGKQYKSAAGARKAVKQGTNQVWDTASVLKSIGLREVFLVIFRRAGPHCVLPAELRAEGLTLFPVLVSIAPLEESGSRQRLKPIEIRADQLLPAAKRAKEVR